MWRFLKKVMTWVMAFVIVVLLVVGGMVVFQTKQTVQRINQLDATIESVAKTYNMEAYIPYIEGIIYTESAAEGTDVMQASESKYGKTNSISTQKESIESGVKFLKVAIDKANKEGCDIWTAIQAYNFGLNYIDYVANRGGVNTIKLAEEYSKKLAEGADNHDYQTYRYVHLGALLYNGGYLYRDGGNFFYVTKIQYAMDVIKVIRALHLA